MTTRIAAVLAGQLPRRGQAQPAAAAGFAARIEGIEHVLAVDGAGACSVVLNENEHRLLGVALHAQTRPTGRRRRLDRISQKAGDHGPHLARIDQQRQRGRRLG